MPKYEVAGVNGKLLPVFNIPALNTVYVQSAHSQDSLKWKERQRSSCLFKIYYQSSSPSWHAHTPTHKPSCTVHIWHFFYFDWDFPALANHQRHRSLFKLCLLTCTYSLSKRTCLLKNSQILSLLTSRTVLHVCFACCTVTSQISSRD